MKLFPLSFPQKDIWNTEQMYPGTSIGNISGTYIFNCELDYTLLNYALNLFLETNDGPRLRMTEQDGEVFQYVSEYRPHEFDLVDCTNGGMEELSRFEERQVKRLFRLLDSQLFYFARIKLPGNRGGFYARFHHLIADGWSIVIVGNQVLDYYFQLKARNEPGRKKWPSYLDLIDQKTAYINSQRFQKDHEFWMEKFRTLPELTALKPLPLNNKSIAAARKTVVLTHHRTTELIRHCTENKITLPAFFAAVLLIYLNRVTGKDDLTIGTPVLNRVNAAEKETPGMFVNVAPLRMALDHNMEFGPLCQKVAAEWLNILKHQQYPYHLLLQQMRERWGMAGNLYDVLISYQNAQFAKHPEIKEPENRWHFCGCQTNSLSLHINDRGGDGELILDYDYQTAVFSGTEIDYLHHRLMRIIDSVMAQNTIRLAEIEILDAAEKDKVLNEFNNTVADYPKDKTIHELFEAQVQQTPDRIAVVYEEHRLSYRELNQKANQIAGMLRQQGVKPGTIVGIMVERSLEMIVGILAILKAGGAILPIDPDYPTERIRYMLENSQPQVLLTQKRLSAKNPWEKFLLYIDEPIPFAGCGSAQSSNAFPCGQNLANWSQPDDLLYIIYTSGTTGMPKGVMITHRNIVNLLFFQFTQTPIDFRRRVLQYTTICFDVSYQEIFSTLLSGGELHLIDNEKRKDINWLFHYIASRQISVIFWPTALVKLILRDELALAQFPSCVKHIITAGEQLIIPGLGKELLRKYQIYLHNHYGPSETHVATTCILDPHGEIPEVPPIGTPVSNTRIYILDSSKVPVPIGVAGELYISGDCVGKGYLNQSELTSEKFGPDPFVPKGTMYRTGDLARWTPEGNLEFLGRTDHQVKIRGFRVEIGEIETHLLNYDSITAAVVVTHEESTGSKSLCAYLVSDRELDLEQLRAYLGKRLPEYMIPASFMQLEKMPLTPNGKIDRKRLPEPVTSKRENFIAPEGETEQKLAHIWQEVLGVEQISAAADFFACGGDSLKAISLVSKIKKEFHAEISIPQFFELKQINKLAQYLSSPQNHQRACDASIQPAASGSRVGDEYFPVSSAQKRIYILQQMEGAGISYNMPGIVRVDGPLDETKFKAAFQVLLQRHEAFRTSFEIVAGEPVQKIHPTEFVQPFDLRKAPLVGVELTIDCREADPEGNPAIMAEFVKPFDLRKAPLIRVCLLRSCTNRHWILFDMHHIISDGASLNILVQELFKIYDGDELPELEIQYKDFAVWQNRLLAENKLGPQADYWLKRFQGEFAEIPVLNLPLDYSRPAFQSFTGDRVRFTIDGELFKALKNLMANMDATLYMVLLTAYYTLLFRYTGQEDIIVGTPVAGRRHADVQNIIGMFVNTLALRNYPRHNKQFREFLDEVKADGLLAFENQEYPLEELLHRLNLRRDASRNPLFDTMFVLQNFDALAHTQAMKDLTFQRVDYESHVAKFDLTLHAAASETGIQFELEYCTKLFTKATVERLAGHFTNILKAVTADPKVLLGEIEIVSGMEKKQLLVDFNQTGVQYPKNKTISVLFEEQAERTPDQVALVFEERQLTYGELNAKANQLAGVLHGKGVQPETIVGIMTEPSLEMVIGILGILKAGGAYLPVDPKSPEERIQYILGETQTKIVLTYGHPPLNRPLGCTLIDLGEPKLYQGPAANLAKISEPHHLAYIIYTSGSTGRPKGVMVEHRNIANTIQWRRDEYRLTGDDNVLQLFSYIFDGFLTSLFTPLTSGSTIVLLPGPAVKDPRIIKKRIISQKITHFIAVPAIFSGILDFLTAAEAEHLRMVTLAGDKVSPEIITRCQSKNPCLEIVNEYGPTENSVATTCCRNLQANRKITIGGPVANNQVYVVNSSGQLQPVGVPGELWISGSGLARGYLNHPELTAQKFAAHPWEPGQKIYKTGDLVKWLPGGHLEFLGRLDHQVKIRGFRIELEEIEGRLCSFGWINNALVVVKTDPSGADYLCAYLTADEPLNSQEIRRQLAKQLPDYMIPSYFIQLDHIPLTPTGKIDRKALLDSLPDSPESVGMMNTGVEYVAPTDETGEKLVRLWQEVLHIEKIGIHDNFFTLGGDSIRAIQVMAKAGRYGFQLSMSDLFQYPTIDELAKHLGDHDRHERAAAEQDIVVGEVKLTPIQHLFFENIRTSQHSFCQYVMLQSKKELEKTSIRKSFAKLMEHHDALRMAYPVQDGQVSQYNRGIQEAAFGFTQVDLTGDSDFLLGMIRSAGQVINNLNFETGLLVQLCLFKTQNMDYLLIVIHHLVVDGVSWRILLEDFISGYHQAESHKDIVLPPKTSSYREWAERLHTYAGSEKLLSELEYWRKLEYSAGTPRQREQALSNFRRDSRTLAVKFSGEVTGELLTGHGDIKINEILLGTLGIVLKGIAGTGQVLINLEGHGREPVIEGIDISRTVGWFTAVFPIVLDLSKTADRSVWINHVKKSLRSIPHHGIGYEILKYLTPQSEKGPLQFRLHPEINFNYLGQFDEGFEETDFRISELPLAWKFSPDMERIQALEVIALIFGGQLIVTFEYDQNEYDDPMMEEMVNQFRAVLNDFTGCRAEAKKTL